MLNGLKVRNTSASFLLFIILLAPLTYMNGANDSSALPNLAGFPDPGGVVRTFNLNGNIDMTGPFFQSLGTNGRACST